MLKLIPQMTKEKVDASKMLREIAKEKHDKVFVVSWSKKGETQFFCNDGDSLDTLAKLEEFKHKLINKGFLK